MSVNHYLAAFSPPLARSVHAHYIHTFSAIIRTLLLSHTPWIYFTITRRDRLVTGIRFIFPWSPPTYTSFSRMSHSHPLPDAMSSSSSSTNSRPAPYQQSYSGHSQHRPSQGGMRNYSYRLEVAQQPVRARMCGTSSYPFCFPLSLPVFILYLHIVFDSWLTGEGFGDKVPLPIRSSCSNCIRIGVQLPLRRA